jgi:hypothetical protein
VSKKSEGCEKATIMKVEEFQKPKGSKSVEGSKCLLFKGQKVKR